MMAYQQQGGMPPGMPPHGHPMMQPGVSGPGQPHVSQAGAMMGMQPGANGPMGGMPGGQHPGAGMGMPGQGGHPGQGMGGHSMPGGQPNPQAMSHLNPQQPMMAQIQHMQQNNPQMQMQHMQNNPQLAMQQHQMRVQQQAMRQAQAAAQAGNMMGMQQGGMQGMNPQQLQMLQQNNAGGGGVVQLPPHLQQQMLQQQAMRQQQQNQQAQLQQQLAMQHANSQQSNQGQPGPPNQQGQPNHPAQMRPQSRMANPNEQTPGPQQQQQQHPQQGQQQGQPQQQPQPQQGQQQPNAQQAQGMTPQQMQNFQQQQQMQMVRQRQAQQQHMQAQRMQAQAHQAQLAAAQNQHRPGTYILRINLLSDHLSNFNKDNGRDFGLWNDFVDRHFAPEGRLLHSFDDNPAPNSKAKTYEVLRPTIARYFETYFESGAQSLRLHTEHANEKPMPNSRYQVSCSNATLTVSYPSGARLEMTGSLNALFSPTSDSIECLEIQQTGAEEIISRSQIENVLRTWSPTMDTKSPKMAKNKLPKAQQKLQQRLDGLTIDDFPKAPKGTMGVTSRVQQFLEIGETMNIMSELMHHSQEKKLRPDQALESWAALQDSNGGGGGGGRQGQGNPQINLPPNGVPMGNRTPSMGNMQMPGNPQGQFSSPSVSNLNLPMQNGAMGGSPHIANNPGLAPGMGMPPNSHTPSPHQSNMAAPPMMPQHSQQGTNSSAASANTSPQVNNKRRRSQVKMEEDGPQDGQAGGQGRVKPSPRMGKKTKPGG